MRRSRALARVAPVAFALATACGGSGASGGAADASIGAEAGTDASLTDASDDAPIADAGPDIDQDPDVYPAKHVPAAQIDNLGGPVLDHAKVVTVTFAGDPARDALRAFDDAIVASDFWKKTLGEYGVLAGTSGGYAELPDTVTGNDTLDNDVQTMIERAIASGAAPRADASTVYVVHFPPNATVLWNHGQLLSCVDFAGYHGAFAPTSDAGASEIVYAVVARCGPDPAQAFALATVATTHALAEAATDPHPDSAPGYRLATNDPWKRSGGSVAKDEVGDLCGIFESVDAGPDAALVQALWSNRAAAEGRPPCQPAATDAIGFGAAVRTGLVDLGPRKSYGYVVVPRGGSAQTIADVFSAAPLPTDLRLLVGIPRPGDPTMMNALPDGVDATLSRTSAHNGQGVVLTIKAPPTAAGQYPFAVRALLDTTHFFDWPVIAVVK